MDEIKKELSFSMYLPIEKSAAGGSYFSGIASNSEIDRDNDQISPELLSKMANDLKANPTVFFNHKHDGLGVGLVSDAWVDNNQLKIKVTPSKAAGAQDWVTQVEEGILRSFSIGGKVKKAEMKYDERTGKDIRVIKDLDLFEVSVVGIPANAGATISGFISKAYKGDMMADEIPAVTEAKVEKSAEVAKCDVPDKKQDMVAAEPVVVKSDDKDEDDKKKKEKEKKEEEEKKSLSEIESLKSEVAELKKLLTTKKEEKLETKGLVLQGDKFDEDSTEDMEKKAKEDDAIHANFFKYSLQKAWKIR